MIINNKLTTNFIIIVCLWSIILTGCSLSNSVTPTPTSYIPPLVVTVVVTPTPAKIAPKDDIKTSSNNGALLNLGPNSISEIVKMVTPWVVTISTETEVRGFFSNFDEGGAGSGFIVRNDGYIVTNWHVVENADDIKVHLPDGQSYDAKIAGRDPVTDIAVLKIPAMNLPSADIVETKNTNVGDWVMTIGNALALKGGPTVTLGIVSGLGRSINTKRGQFYGLIQTDAAVNVGNSGGPMVNMKGEVIGINQATLRQAEGISFAASITVAGPVIKSLIENGVVIRPRIGLIGRDMTSTLSTRYGIGVSEGVIITNISRSGPAFTAGLEIGDVITKIDAIPTTDLAEFLTTLWSYEVNAQITVEFVRGIETKTAVIKLAKRLS